MHEKCLGPMGKTGQRSFGRLFSLLISLQGPVIHQPGLQQSLSERLGERRRLGREVPVPVKSGKTSSDIYLLPSLGKDAGFGQILSFENQQARALNSCSQVVGDKTGKAIWKPVKEA